MSTVEESIDVEVPVRAAYNQWTQFEDFPRFMDGVESVTQLADDRLEWVAEIAGVRRQWIAKILEQVPDQKVAWAAVEGATNAGEVTFTEAGTGQAEVHLTLEYEPEGFVEGVGDRLGIVERQAEGDLERFKEFVEAHPRAAGAWRGSISEGILEPLEGEEATPSSPIGTIEVGSPPTPKDRGLNATDAASGFGDPALEEAPGVVRGLR